MQKTNDKIQILQSPILLWILLGMLLFPEAMGARITIALKPDVDVAAMRVTVADVADMSGTPAVLRESIGKVQLSGPLRPNTNRTIQSYYVRSRLIQHGVPEEDSIHLEIHISELIPGWYIYSIIVCFERF